MSEQKIVAKNNLGFGDNKTKPPESTGEVITLLAKIMSHALNNTIDLENAKVALNAATRIIEVQQADTRMKALAIQTNRIINKSDGWSLVSTEPKQIEQK